MKGDDLPSATLKAEAKELARRILEADRSDASIVKVVITYLTLTGRESSDRHPLLDQAFWLLASALLRK